MNKKWKKWSGQNPWFKAGLVGGVVAFVWSMLSWMVLPWHNTQMRGFSNEGQAVSAALSAEAMKPGFYMIPNMDPKNCGDKKMMARWESLAARGPYAFLMVKPQGHKSSMACSMIVMVLMSLGAGLLAAFLLTKTTLRKMQQRALFVAVVIGVGAAMAHLSNLAWWGFPGFTTTVNIVDAFLTWYLAGLAITKMQKGT